MHAGLQLTANDLVRAYGRPDGIWLSPPCRWYSVARGEDMKTRDYTKADALVCLPALRPHLNFSTSFLCVYVAGVHAS